jgi:hypothetical protein
MYLWGAKSAPEGSTTQLLRWQTGSMEWFREASFASLA